MTTLVIFSVSDMYLTSSVFQLPWMHLEGCAVFVLFVHMICFTNNLSSFQCFFCFFITIFQCTLIPSFFWGGVTILWLYKKKKKLKYIHLFFVSLFFVNNNKFFKICIIPPLFVSSSSMQVIYIINVILKK